MKKFFLTIFYFLAVSISVSAQNELSLYNLNNVFQSTIIDPSKTSQHTLSIGLPALSSINIQVANSGFRYGDLLQTDGNRNNRTDTLRGDIYNAYNKLNDQNYFFAGADIDLFHIRIKSRSMYFSFFSQVNTKLRVSYPKSFVDLIVNGNSDKLGEDINFKSLGTDIEVYKTMGFGITKEWKKWSFGTNVKYLSGIANMYFKPGLNSGLRFEDPDYRIVSLSDMTLYSSGFKRKGSSNDDVYFPDEKDDFINFTKNPGGAIDLAATYNINDKWLISGSVLNVGFIHWSADIQNRNISGGLDFKGFDVFSQFVRGEETSDSALTSEFENSFKYKTNTNSYTKWLIPQFYFSTKYNYSHKTQFGLTVHLEKYKKLRSALSFSVTHKMGRIVNLVGTYNLQYQRFDNIGLGLMLKLGPCQFYAAGDNLLVPIIKTIGDGFEITKNTVDPLQNINLRMGMNLVFGKVHGSGNQSSPYSN